MFCTVYPLKKNGQRLPDSEAKESGLRGDLRLTQKRPNGMPAVEARVLDDHGNSLKILTQAEVRQIDECGMLIRGYEKELHTLIPQIWWCVIEPQVA